MMRKKGRPAIAPGLERKIAGVCFPPLIFEKLDAEAKAKGMARSAFISAVLKKHFEDESRQENSNIYLA